MLDFNRYGLDFSDSGCRGCKVRTEREWKCGSARDEGHKHRMEGENQSCVIMMNDQGCMTTG